MPKQKTHKATAKRVRVTGKGKLVHAKSGMRHNLEHKSSEVTRRLQGMAVVADVDTPRLKRLLGK